MAESQPSKLLVAGSIPVSRSSSNRNWKLENHPVERKVFPASFEFRVSIFSARFAGGGPM